MRSPKVAVVIATVTTGTQKTARDSGLSKFDFVSGFGGSIAGHFKRAVVSAGARVAIVSCGAGPGPK